MLRSSSLAILPAGTGAFLRRRVLELCGMALIGAALLLVLALASYDPADRSFNNATAAPTTNLLGSAGAYAADLLLHWAGLAAAVPLLALVVWGWQLLYHRPLKRLGLKLPALLAAMLLLASGLGGSPDIPGWPLVAGNGGAIGRLAFDGLLLPLSASVAGLTEPLLASAAVLLGVGCWVLGLGLGATDWQQLAASFRSAGRAAALSGRQMRALGGWLGDRPGAVASGFIWRRATAAGAAGGASEQGGGVGAAAPLVATKAPRMKSGRKTEERSQGSFDFDEVPRYRQPPIELLQATPLPTAPDAANRMALEQNARMLKTVLDDFGVRGEIVKVRPGPVITLYELEPAPGTKSARVIALADDIARSMSAISARVAVVPGRNVIGIELPNPRREPVSLRELLGSEAFERFGGGLTLALGKDIGGAPVFVDLARMPHLLIAGTTGSGKSVAINGMILSLLYRLAPETCRFILIDPKMLELSVYEGIPHLLCPVVTEPGKAVVALKWTVREMEDRYRAMSQLGVRNIAGYNARIHEAKKKNETLVRRVQTGFDDAGQPVFEEQQLDLEPLPLIVVVVDEMADLMLVAGKDIEAAVQRLAQMARAAGIHLIMATQRPSVDVITGTIKANFPTRISFQVTSKIDSRTILGEQGAEQLLGQGDMLFMAPGGRVTRVHGPFVSDAEVESVVHHLKTLGTPRYLVEVTEAEDDGGFRLEGGGEAEENDALYDEAVAIVLRDGKASTSFVQRRLQIGYNRAARLVERMEAEGLVSKPDRVGRREVLAGEQT